MTQVHSIGNRGRSRAAAAPPSPEMQVWDGALDEAELAKPGGLLLAALVSAASRRGHQLNTLAEQLGITYGYLAQLRNGTKKVNLVGDDFVLACATYLRVPRLTVLMLAGRITPVDFFETEATMARDVERAYEMVCDDPTWGPLQTAELRKTSLESKFTLVRLYEQATGLRVMPASVDLSALAAATSRMAAEAQAQAQAQASGAVLGTAKVAAVA